MRKILRGALLATGAAALVVTGAAPAHAVDVVVFAGTAHINCFGCGTSTGTGSFCAYAKVHYPPPSADVCVGFTSAYTVAEGTGVTCVVTGSADGTTSGPGLNTTFHWTRVGATAVISVVGDINGSGVAGFVVTSPAGIPCGGPVDAEVVGAVAGA